jgi:hypothetical protein
VQHSISKFHCAQIYSYSCFCCSPASLQCCHFILPFWKTYSLSTLSAVTQLNLLNMTVTLWTTADLQIMFRTKYAGIFMICLRTGDFYNGTNACNWLLQNIQGIKSYYLQRRPDKFLRYSFCLAWAKSKLQHILRGSTILSQKLKAEM